MFNFTCRFIYEIFLELCLCALISIAHPKYGTFDFKASVAILIVCTTFIVYTMTLWNSFFLRTQRGENNNRHAVYKENVPNEPNLS